MTFWGRFLGRRPTSGPRAAVDAAREEADPLAASADLERLRRLGSAGGPGTSEAAALFRALRATAEEPRAIDAIAAAASAGVAPEPLVVAAAAALAERGERDRALALVTSGTLPATSLEARMLAADLHAARGELTLALPLVERVLVRDLDHPGARERHQRWRAQLGLDTAAARAPAVDRAATVISRQPDAPFVLLREVARGGAGAVYEAQDRELGRRVALKIYHHAERDRAQLLHEARVASALAGRNVVRVLDVDPIRGWLALEWAAFGSLRQRLREGDRDLVVSMRTWAFGLASALARVHASGWVHHDVKPGNVLFDARDQPVLADFGTARRAGEPSPPGSLGYVSPERIAGRSSDPRDDVFGFGRILEDTLEASLVAGADSEAWSALAAACTGPDVTRPADGRALVTRLRVESTP